MKRLALVIQGDENLSHRQRILVNPVRFRTPQELKDVLCSELNHPDGTPMVLPPSASLSYFDSITGKYIPLKDTSVLTNNSRIRVERGATNMNAAASTSTILSSTFAKTLHSGTAAAAAAIPNGFFDPATTESAITELLVFLAQVVSLLSSHVRPEREITPQDINAAYEMGSEAVRDLVVDMWKQKNVTNPKAGGPGLLASAMSQARIVTQFALQRGATEREASDGDAADRLKETVSAFQRRVNRLEKELVDVTAMLEHTQQLLLVASQEKEKIVFDLEHEIHQFKNENELLRAAAREAVHHSVHVEKELAVAVETQQRALLDSFIPLDDTDIGVSATENSFRELDGVKEGTLLPTTLQEEKYLDITRRGAAAQQSATAGNSRIGTPSVGGHHSLIRPTTAPAGTNSVSAARHHHVLFADSKASLATPTAAPLNVSSLVSPLSVIVRSLARGSLAARQESLSLDEGVQSSFGKCCLLLKDRCGFAHSSVIEISFIANGVRKIISDEFSYADFITTATQMPPQPGAIRGPAPISLSVIEFDPRDKINDALSESPIKFVDEEQQPGGLQPQGSDGDMASQMLTEAQKARLSAAQFLGKPLTVADVLPKKKSHGDDDDSDDSDGGGSPTSPDAMKSSPKSSKLMSVVSKLKKQSTSRSDQPDALSTRSLFLHAASITVPTDDEMKAMFSSLARGEATIDRRVLAEFLVKRYDDMGDPEKYYRMVGLPVSMARQQSRSAASNTATAVPTSTIRCSSAAPRMGSVDLDEFCMVLYRLVRE